MAVERTGTAVTVNTASDTGSQSITVPADCTFALMFSSGWYADRNNGNVSIGGRFFDYVLGTPSASVYVNMGCRYLVNPPTGSQTLTWDAGISPEAEGNLIFIIFYKGVDIRFPIRDSNSRTSPSSSNMDFTGLTTTTGDMTVAAVNTIGAAPPTLTGDSQTLIGSLGTDAKSSTVYMACGEKASSATFQTDNPLSDCTAIVVVLRVHAPLIQHSFRFFNDDDSESAATAKAALNTNINLVANDVARLRFLIDASPYDPLSKNFQLEFRRKPSGGSFGDWKRVTTN